MSISFVHLKHSVHTGHDRVPEKEPEVAVMRTDAEHINDANWEGSVVAVLAGFIVENGQLMQYLVGHGVSQNVLMTIITVLVQRLWVYVRAVRPIAQAKLEQRIAQMAQDAKAQAVSGQKFQQ